MLYAFLTRSLILTWGAPLVVGFAFGRPDETREGCIRRPARLLSSPMLVVCALVWCQATASGTELVTAAAFLCLGITLSFLGDLITAKVQPLGQRPLLGMAVFGLSRVVYMIAYVQLGRILGAASATIRAVVVAAFWSASALLWRKLVRSDRQPMTLNIVSLAYAFLLATMTALAVSIALQQPRLGPPTLGALLFTISDLLLGHRLFQGGTSRWSTM